jgi:S1-C subfamily serine protease
VVADTAAKEAGIQTDDVIRKVNGVSVRSYEQVILAIGSFKAGDVLQLDILRGEAEELQVQAKLRSRPADQ